MRTASGYQAPAVPYHTPIVTDFSTPNLILPSGTRNILPTEGQSKESCRQKNSCIFYSLQNFTFSLHYSASLLLCFSALKSTTVFRLKQ
jgi:hypothetical protein